MSTELAAIPETRRREGRTGSGRRTTPVLHRGHPEVSSKMTVEMALIEEPESGRDLGHTLTGRSKQVCSREDSPFAGVLADAAAIVASKRSSQGSGIATRATREFGQRDGRRLGPCIDSFGNLDQPARSPRRRASSLLVTAQVRRQFEEKSFDAQCAESVWLS